MGVKGEQLRQLIGVNRSDVHETGLTFDMRGAQGHQPLGVALDERIRRLVAPMRFFAHSRLSGAEARSLQFEDRAQAHGCFRKMPRFSKPEGSAYRIHSSPSMSSRRHVPPRARWQMNSITPSSIASACLTAGSSGPVGL